MHQIRHNLINVFPCVLRRESCVLRPISLSNHIWTEGSPTLYSYYTKLHFFLKDKPCYKERHKKYQIPDRPIQMFLYTPNGQNSLARHSLWDRNLFVPMWNYSEVAYQIPDLFGYCSRGTELLYSLPLQPC